MRTGEQGLLTIPGHPHSPMIISGICICSTCSFQLVRRDMDVKRRETIQRHT
jgi:hypothetical protein